MTHPATEPGYLESAAAELRKARDANEKRLLYATALHSGRQDEAQRILRDVDSRRMEIAAAFTRLAECQAGLPPCCHRARPEQEQES